jgi:hypothetical protein
MEMNGMKKKLLLVAILASVVLSAHLQTFRIDSVREIAKGPTASRFQSAVVALMPADPYLTIDAATTPLRLSGALLNLGHARNELFCYDLKEAKERWTRYLDAPLVSFIQTEEAAYALSYASLSAFDLQRGTLLWQLSLDTLGLRNPPRLSRTKRDWTWPDNKDMEKDLALYGRDKPLMAFDAQKKLLWLWSGKGQVVALDPNTGIVAASIKGSESSSYLALVTSGTMLFALASDRSLSFYRGLGVKGGSVYLPDSFRYNNNSLALVPHPDRPNAVLACTGKVLALWEPEASGLKLYELEKEGGGFYKATSRGLYKRPDSGLYRVAFEASQKKAEFAGNSTTVWILLIPHTGALPSLPFDEMRIGVQSFLPVWQGNSFWILNPDDLSPIQELKLDGFDNDGMHLLASVARGAEIPPYIDYASKRAYFVLSKCNKDLPVDNIQPGEVIDYLVTLAWE